MLTYKKTIEKPRLEIYYDELSESPREWCNNSILVTTDHADDKDYLKRLRESVNEVTSADDHLELMTEYIEEQEKSEVLYSNFISKYEHSGVVYKLGQYSGWDYGIIGMIFVTEKLMKEISDKSDSNIENLILHELEMLNRWANGETYRFILFDKEGNQTDSCGSFYCLEDIKVELPEEFKDEIMYNYLKH